MLIRVHAVCMASIIVCMLIYGTRIHSHTQASGGDQCRALALMLEARGKRCWYDQDEEIVTKAGMQEGVRNSKNVLVFLSDGVMGRPYCRSEMRWGKQYGCGFVGVREVDERHCPADFEKEMRLAPSDLKHLFEDVNVSKMHFVSHLVIQYPSPRS